MCEEIHLSRRWVGKGTVGSKVVQVIKTTANMSNQHSRGVYCRPGLSQSLYMDEIM